MKKDRNCGMGAYPSMMPGYGGMVMPGQMIPMPGVIDYPMASSSNNYSSSDLSSLSSRINNLEQRVSRLENYFNNGSYSNNYNSSNYQMM